MIYNNNKIIAIGDIHGDFHVFIEILLKAELINFKDVNKINKYDFNNIYWTGNNTYVVQIGDILDGKRPNTLLSKEYYDEPMEIKLQNFLIYIDYLARLNGGRVISLFGNHELYPYLKYNDKVYEKNYVKRCDTKEYYKLFKKSRFKYYYPGNEGAILLGKHKYLLLQLGKYLFCHGSITKKFLDLYAINTTDSDGNNQKRVSIDKINEEMSNWLITGNKNKIPKFMSLKDDEHPLFSKVLTSPEYMSEEDCEKYTKDIFNYFNGVEYLIVGHSVHKKINCICNCIYQIDTGLSRAFGETLDNKIKRLNYLIL